MSGVTAAGLSTEAQLQVRADLINAVDAALMYDFLQDRKSPATEPAGLVKNHMTRLFRERLIVRRRVFERLLSNAKVGRNSALIGAPGCGKSTILIDLRRELNTSSQAEVLDSGLPTFGVIVFNGNAHSLSDLASGQAFKKYIERIVLRAVVRRYARGKTGGLDPRWNFSIVQRAEQFDLFRTRFPAESPDELQDLITRDTTAGSSWQTAMERYERLNPAERFRSMVDMFKTTNHHLVIALDNLDPLRVEAIAGAADAAAAFESASTATIGVIIAVRPETRARAADRLNFAQFDPIEATAIDGLRFDAAQPDALREDLRHVMEIFERRLAIFDGSEREFLEQLGDVLSRDSSGALEARIRPTEVRAIVRRDIARLHTTARRVLQDYFALDMRSELDKTEPGGTHDQQNHRSARADLTTVFLAWHNESIRELARSLSHFATTFIPTSRAGEVSASSPLRDPTSPDERRTATVRRTRTALFRHLLFFGVDSLDDERPGIARLHPSLRLFLSVDTGDSAHFVFLRARVLQYLNRRVEAGEEAIRYGDLERDVCGVFGVRKAELEAAVQDVSRRAGYESGLIRIERKSQARMRDNDSLELLPAGQILISRICKTVEFMYWCAATDPDGQSEVMTHLGVSASEMNQEIRYNDDSFRAEVTLLYLARVLLRRFKREHRYIDPDVSPTKKDLQRLRDFCLYFGFSEGKWFLSQCLEQHRAFVRTNRGCRISQAAEGWRDEIEKACGRLDEIVDMPVPD